MRGRPWRGWKHAARNQAGPCDGGDRLRRGRDCHRLDRRTQVDGHPGGPGRRQYYRRAEAELQAAQALTARRGANCARILRTGMGRPSLRPKSHRNRGVDSTGHQHKGRLRTVVMGPGGGGARGVGQRPAGVRGVSPNRVRVAPPGGEALCDGGSFRAGAGCGRGGSRRSSRRPYPAASTHRKSAGTAATTPVPPSDPRKTTGWSVGGSSGPAGQSVAYPPGPVLPDHAEVVAGQLVVSGPQAQPVGGVLGAEEGVAGLEADALTAVVVERHRRRGGQAGGGTVGAHCTIMSWAGRPSGCATSFRVAASTPGSSASPSAVSARPARAPAALPPCVPSPKACRSVSPQNEGSRANR